MRTVLGWEAWEAEVNEKLGLSTTVASGATDRDPGDGVDRRHHSRTDYPLQVDAKHTIKGSYAVNRKFMRESWERATNAGKAFALPIRFADAESGVGKAEDYVVIPFNDYQGLLQVLRESEHGTED